ncbi:hypothetical protein [Methanoregula sp.]|uniref:hypothetical protein n=1 Tax=Methanoregula sp. TaxID=2052170 RepID=UPI000CB2789D|nr:hypothetical protein [Methanoregula sp.]PKG31321.1 MAG: hypothetical protein CW742_14020 [Methanoregula sp.]
MAPFIQKTGPKSAVRNLKNPFPDIEAFDSVVRSLIFQNPLGCMSFRSQRKSHPPVERVRAMYTAKFVYRNAKGKRIGGSIETYNSVDGYQYGIHAVLANMANAAAHGGRAIHVPEDDLFAVTLKCHDPDSGLYFLSLARDRVTLSSFADESILARVEAWADGVPGLK